MAPSLVVEEVIQLARRMRSATPRAPGSIDLELGGLLVLASAGLSALVMLVDVFVEAATSLPR